MKVISETDPNIVTDIICDMCGDSTRVDSGQLQFGTMHASWGEGSSRCGEEYELHMCENCFFVQVSTMQRTRWVSVMFDDKGDAILGHKSFSKC
ncbi:hypothetical protein [Pseudomonas guariconensis]|uniref:hypothetical protein n=1 Tax=Pseudomonas guariconensis TaxID=1288410 RepID=UPI0018ABBA22|nr:hypothetical protein [Pseudomonas guariconensis]MBF8742096.1 hypothetical protein [Pseudomonas guariconensis]MBF8751092.1 hypothetical protein [Pseudomonas guariconensis]